MKNSSYTMTNGELSNCKNDTLEMYNKFKKLCNDDSITDLTHEDIEIIRQKKENNEKPNGKTNKSRKNKNIAYVTIYKHRNKFYALLYKEPTSLKIMCSFNTFDEALVYLEYNLLFILYAEQAYCRKINTKVVTDIDSIYGFIRDDFEIDDINLGNNGLLNSIANEVRKDFRGSFTIDRRINNKFNFKEDKTFAEYIKNNGRPSKESLEKFDEANSKYRIS